ncbi:MAG: hypothetical protein NTW86_26125 [Candidatus Sumerlaeota bacterium]|nr:hypothetical protein [Candidatus Sumerlaeota bacterium]
MNPMALAPRERMNAVWILWRLSICAAAVVATTGCRELSNLRRISAEQETRIGELTKELDSLREEHYTLKADKEREVLALQARIEELSQGRRGLEQAAAGPASAEASPQRDVEMNELREQLRSAQEQKEQELAELKNQLEALRESNRSLTEENQQLETQMASLTGGAAPPALTPSAPTLPLRQTAALGAPQAPEAPAPAPAGGRPPLGAASPTPAPSPGPSRQTPLPAAAPNLRNVGDQLASVLADPLSRKQVLLERAPDRVTVIIWSDLVFTSGAQIAPRIEDCLRAVGQILNQDKAGGILVEAHAGAPDAQRLTEDQALQAAQHMERGAGLDPSRVQAVGCGDSTPRYPVDSPEDVAGKNNRIEISLRAK